MPSLTPYLTIDGAAEAIEFYKRAFGAEEMFRMDMPDGRIGHASMQFGESSIMLSDPFGEDGFYESPKGRRPGTGLYFHVDDVDAVFEQAVKAGATVQMPLENAFWGDRWGRVVDPFGHVWELAQHVEDVSPEEIGERAKQMFAGAPQG
jgi:PhnB protein